MLFLPLEIRIIIEMEFVLLIMDLIKGEIISVSGPTENSAHCTEL